MKDTVAGQIVNLRRTLWHEAIIVDRPAGSSIFASKRDIEVVVEIRVVGRDPTEFPTHSFAHGFDLIDRRPRDGHVADFMVLEVRQDSVNVIDFERATDTLRR